jgi:hypothetical protein
MHRLIYFVFIIVVIHLGLCSDTFSDDLIMKEDNDIDTDTNSSLLITTTISAIEPIDENIIDNVTKSITTTIINEEQVKSFFTQVYFLLIPENISIICLI